MKPNSNKFESVFSGFRHLKKYSLAGMVCLLQHVGPNLSKGDVMGCLLMSDFHVRKASTMEEDDVPLTTQLSHSLKKTNGRESYASIKS